MLQIVLHVHGRWWSRPIRDVTHVFHGTWNGLVDLRYHTFCYTRGATRIVARTQSRIWNGTAYAVLKSKKYHLRFISHLIYFGTVVPIIIIKSWQKIPDMISSHSGSSMLKNSTSTNIIYYKHIPGY